MDWKIALTRSNSRQKTDMVTALVRSEKDLRKQAQLAEEIKFFFSNECNGKFLCKCYSGICHLQSGHLDKQQSFRAIRDAGESTQSQQGLFMS